MIDCLRKNLNCGTDSDKSVLRDGGDSVCSGGGMWIALNFGSKGEKDHSWLKYGLAHMPYKMWFLFRGYDLKKDAN